MCDHLIPDYCEPCGVILCENCGEDLITGEKMDFEGEIQDNVIRRNYQCGCE